MPPGPPPRPILGEHFESGKTRKCQFMRVSGVIVPAWALKPFSEVHRRLASLGDGSVVQRRVSEFPAKLQEYRPTLLRPEAARKRRGKGIPIERGTVPGLREALRPGHPVFSSMGWLKAEENTPSSAMLVQTAPDTLPHGPLERILRLCLDHALQSTRRSPRYLCQRHHAVKPARA